MASIISSFLVVLLVCIVFLVDDAHMSSVHTMHMDNMKIAGKYNTLVKQDQYLFYFKQSFLSSMDKFMRSISLKGAARKAKGEYIPLGNERWKLEVHSKVNGQMKKYAVGLKKVNPESQVDPQTGDPDLYFIVATRFEEKLDVRFKVRGFAYDKNNKYEQMLFCNADNENIVYTPAYITGQKYAVFKPINTLKRLSENGINESETNERILNLIKEDVEEIEEESDEGEDSDDRDSEDKAQFVTLKNPQQKKSVRLSIKEQ